METQYVTKITNSNDISSRFKQMIKEKGITQKVFCEQTAISTGHLSKVLTGRAIPSGAMLISIANEGCDVNWLLTGESSKFQIKERDLEIEKLELIVKELKSLINFNMKN